MSDYRIVFNAQTARFRVERRRLLDWTFVMDASGQDYLTFDSFEEAQQFVCDQRESKPRQNRRWEVVEPCGCE